MKTKDTLCAVGILLLSLIAVVGQTNPNGNRPPRHVEGELLVKFADGPRGAVAARTKATLKHDVKRHFDFIGWQQIKLPAGLTVEEGLARYRNLPGVEAVEPNGMLERSASPVVPKPHQVVAASADDAFPNDPLFRQQYWLEKIDASNAWAVTTGSRNVVVALIDTGINYYHEDLSANLWRNPGEIPANGLDEDGNGFVDDVLGIDTASDAIGNDSDPFDIWQLHGTASAGMIGAAGHNGVGISGVNWSVQIMALRIWTTNGTAGFADLIEAVNYVTLMKRRGVNIRIASLSIAFPTFSQAVKDAHDALAREGVLQVAAAHNYGLDLDVTPWFPACWDIPGMMSIAASDEFDNLGDDAYWPGSSYGRTNVDLAAPGVAIVTTFGPGTNDYTPIFDLTSAATPLVSGAAALLFAANPSLTMEEVKDILIETVDVLPAFTNKMVSNGRLNLGRAMQHPNVRTNSPPIFAAQPRDAVTAPGGSALLAARVIGTKPFRFQWQRDGSDVANATNVALTLTDATAGQAGDYALVASNAFGVVTSDVARVAVTTAPVITAQPQSQTVIGGSSVTLSVRVAGQAPLEYLWSRDGTPVAGSNADIVLNNVQGTNAGGYLVVVTNPAGAVTSEVAVLDIILKPVITNQPQSVSVSVGATVILRVGATGLPFLTHQWQQSDANLPGAISPLLVLANVQPGQAGDYSAVVTNGGGAVTSQVATVTVDATFTKVTSGPIVAEMGTNAAGAWGDYDGDGYTDLFVTKRSGAVNALFRNNRDRTFTKVAAVPLTSDRGDSFGAAWGDYDRDGDLDLVVANAFGMNEFIYCNNGNGTFSRLTTNDVGAVAGTGGDSAQCAWADFDNDGQLDLFVANGGPTGAQNNSLFRNNGEGVLLPIQGDPVVTDGGRSYGGAWGDFDNDGRLDLFVANGWAHENFLYRNTGNDSFVRVLTNAIATAPLAHHVSAAWGDYDNDGDLDLFVAAYPWNRLFRNDGSGAFAEVAATSGIVEKGNHNSGAWADFDNDGFLDLFVSNETERPGNLYRNNGNGTFSRVTTGSPANDLTVSLSAAWADFDNNGFPDLFVAGALGTTNALYRNNGNSNHWLTLKLLGTRSNRQAVGAKVRVRATINGATRWQLRQVGGDAGLGQNDSRAAFGLGDATNAEVVRIEWPSGTVQELTNVTANQFLTVTEPGFALARDVLDASVRLGSNITLNVIAYSDEPLTFQWSFNEAELIAATNSTLQITNAQVAHDGGYSVRINDGVHSITSRTARLVVLQNPAFVQAPLSQTVVERGNITVSVTITGNPAPFGYHWRRGPTPLATIVSGERTCFFTLTNVQLSQGGTHRVLFTNAAFPIFSIGPTFTITVLPDTNTNGLPDAWESIHGLTDPLADADGDSMNNLEEYIAGTHPTNGLDYLKVEHTGVPGSNTLSFLAVSNRTYTVEFTEALGIGLWTKLADFIARATNRVERTVDLSPGNRRFYRLVTPQQPVGLVGGEDPGTVGPGGDPSGGGEIGGPGAIGGGD